MRGLAKPLHCTAAGAFPFSVGCFAVYINLEKLWQEPPSRFNSLQNFINGCLAAGVAQSLSYPFDTVKRKMQVKYEWTTLPLDVVFNSVHQGAALALLSD